MHQNFFHQLPKHLLGHRSRLAGSHWVAVGTLVLSDLYCLGNLSQSPQVTSLLPSTQGSGRKDFSAAGGIGKPTALLEQCQVPPGGSPAAPAWPMAQAPLIIEQKYCSYQHISPSFSPTAALMLMSGVLLFHLGTSSFAVALTPTALRMGFFNQQIFPLPYRFASSLSVASHCCFFLPL